MAFTEDLSVFFDADEFAVMAQLAGGAEIPVIFDREYIEAHGPAGVDSTQPLALAQTSQVVERGLNVRGAAITILGTAYRVRSTQPDGTGLTLLFLELA